MKQEEATSAIDLQKAKLCETVQKNGEVKVRYFNLRSGKRDYLLRGKKSRYFRVEVDQQGLKKKRSSGANSCESVSPKWTRIILLRPVFMEEDRSLF